MNKEKEYWENIIKIIDTKASSYDGWLDQYHLEELPANATIVELGCGWGDDTDYLKTLNAQLICCDFSSEAIDIIQKRFPEVETSRFDMTETFPFESGSATMAVADLCLHYFSDGEMNHILKEIKRVLKPGGMLLCRVNSDKDIHHGAGQGEEIEKGYYLKDGLKKRFFDKELIEQCFSEMEIVIMEEYALSKYPKPKVVWEIRLK